MSCLLQQLRHNLIRTFFCLNLVDVVCSMPQPCVRRDLVIYNSEVMSWLKDLILRRTTPGALSMTLQAQGGRGLNVYWDYGTTRLNAVSGYEVVRKIRSALHRFGPIQCFKMYHDSSNQPLSGLHSELGSSGVTLIDCPSDGRKETTTKTMIVDIIAHTLDHPAPRTVVVITGDRDLAYPIATLRMRQYQVILMSPSGTHASLTNQASVNLDWTTGIANIDGRRTDMDDSRAGQPSPRLPPSPRPPPSPHPPPLPNLFSSPSFPPPPVLATNGLFFYPRTNFSSGAQEEPIELQGMPTRGRERSIFPHSCEPDRFNIFGGLGGSFASPKIVNGMFGLGDGPSFARPQPRGPARQVRSDSAPPEIVYSPSRPCSPPESNDFGGLASSAKREFPITEPEDVAPLTSGTRSSVTTHNSAFSVIQFPPSTAPPSVEPVSIDNNDTTDRGKKPATIIVLAPQVPTSATPKSPAVRNTEKVSAPPGKEEMSKAISTKDSPRPVQPQAPSLTPPLGSKKAPPLKGMTVDAQAGPSRLSSPMQFRVLVDTLRQHKEPYHKNQLPSALLACDPDVYKKANVRKYKDYLAAAVGAGLIQEVNCRISLTAQYA